MAQCTIKQTKSLSPVSYNEVEARVINDDGRVYLEKQDEQGRAYKFLIEKDYEIYNLMTKAKPSVQVRPINFQIAISSECNLNCPICYEPKHKAEPSLEDIEGILRNYKGKVVVLCGREPTCRSDLFQIIKISNKRNRASLLTNGLKLADYEYVLRLKKSGLRLIFFSFNGFKDDIYQKMNGRPLLDMKLRALDNIKRIGIPTILSATLAEGINDDQIKKLCEFCLDNRSFISALRIRSISPVGKHLNIEPYCMSGLLELLAGALGIKREDIIKEYIFWQEIINSLKFIIPVHVRTYASSRLCTLAFHIKKGEEISSLGSKINIQKIKGSRFKIPLLTRQLQ